MKNENLDLKSKKNVILGFDPAELVILSDKDDKKPEKKEFLEFIPTHETTNYTHIDRCIRYNHFNIKDNKKKVYLAGKISHYDWRETIYPMRDSFYGGNKHNLKKEIYEYNDDTIITGPFFLSCDHGCYHGDNSHGLGINSDGCPAAFGDYYTEYQVYDICTTQIKNSNIVFAFINDDTCYGTLYEIGYAKSIGKKIIIIFDSYDRLSKMWFMCQDADIVDVLNKETIKDMFDNIMKKIY